MRSDPPPWRPQISGRVLHVVGCITNDVMRFLGPATNVLARAGCEQSLVMIDSLRHRHHMVGLHESVELALVPHVRNPVRQWADVARACREFLADPSLQAVHLHGLRPALVGAHAVRSARVQVPTFFSAPSSSATGAMNTIGSLALALLRPTMHPARHVALTNWPREVPDCDRWTDAQLAEGTVSDAFFQVVRREARHPLIVTSGRTQGPRHSALYSQLAVLLGGEDLRLGFNWFGTVDEVSRACMVAANVGVFDVADDAECASRLAAGWIYVAPAGTRGFALHLAEAMAVGLPCVALDCMQHREVLRDSETGYLCKTSGDMMECIATLIDDASLRLRIGNAARLEAQRRFVGSEIGERLIQAYALPTSAGHG